MADWFPRCGGSCSRNSWPKTVLDAAPVSDCSAASCPGSSLQCLPDNVLLRIFCSFSPLVLATKISLVSRRWNRLAYNTSLWRRLDVEISNFDRSRELTDLLVRVCDGIENLALYVREEGLSLESVVVAGLIPRLSRLRILDLGFNKGLDIAVLDFVIDQCPNVASINVEGVKAISDASLEAMWRGWPELREICLSHCESLTVTGITDLVKNVSNLRMLNIDGITCISDEPVVELGRWQSSSLTRLYLDGAELSNVSIIALAGCKQLRLLSVSFCDGLTDLSLRYLEDFTQLEHLHLRKGSGFSAAAIHALFQSPSFPRLRFLSLAECSEMDDACVDAITTCCPHLRSLCLSWCWSISEEGLNKIITRLGDIYFLDLVGLDTILGLYFIDVPDLYLSKVRFLDLSQCNLIHDELVVQMVRRQPKLTVANYYGELLTKESVEQSAGARAHCIDRDLMNRVIDGLPGGCCMTAI